MGDGNKKSFADKHGPEAVISPAVRDAIADKTTGNDIPCAIAMKIAEDLHIDPSEVGVNIDLLNMKIVKCQLGLFGYKPANKIVKASDSPEVDIQEAIRSELTAGKMLCKSAWEIAQRLDVPKLRVGELCEADGIKIICCQLGAF